MPISSSHTETRSSPEKSHPRTPWSRAARLMPSISTVWATILYEVLWNLVEKHGNSEARQPTFNGKVPTDGKFLTMKLVIDGMALQPCSPTFVQARDAIIDANKALTGGANRCELWKAFAKRGLGQGPSMGSGSTGRKESTTVPSGVC
ncbi:hypothetical protein GMDG_03203 [Pseudogymnoascus destructans 20631-21]|uniref:Extracellular metalloproteinase n=2 Tax=Pseudogymnoascus destructans TaxID=655981 RepID=L8G6N0_PSED2|nr:hypothetical protein GMDG_03203 [Pseudogymnoascus destructans 20631-21]